MAIRKGTRGAPRPSAERRRAARAGLFRPGVRRLILLDTNVLSELMRSDVTPAVEGFFRAHRKADLFTSALCVAEIGCGIARLPAGRRRERLTATFDELMAKQFRARILAFDEVCARAYAIARAQHEGIGRTVAIVDMLIAATALAHGAAIATRNIRDFEPFGLPLINPWLVR